MKPNWYNLTKLAQEKPPFSYLHIGHYPTREKGHDQAYVLNEESGDLSLGPPNTVHNKEYGTDPYSQIGGRIDHTKKQISISPFRMGDPTNQEKIEYTIRLLKMDYPDYKIYLFNNREIQRIAQEKPPKSYLDIGHYGYPYSKEEGQAQAYIFDENIDDIRKGVPNKGHGHPDNGFYGAPIGGRIDHTKKQISITNHANDFGKLDYAISLLQMDYPDYKIYLMLPNRGFQRIAQEKPPKS